MLLKSYCHGLMIAILGLSSCKSPPKKNQKLFANPNDPGALDSFLSRLGHIDSSNQENARPERICAGIIAPPEKACPVLEEKTIGGKSFVCTYQDSRQTVIPTELSVINSNADSLWPGALIQGASVAEGSLNPVPINSRLPGTITLTLATGGTGQFSEQLKQPSLSTATEAINKILSTNLQGPTPAKLAYRVEQVHDNNQIKLALKAGFKGLSWSGSGSLSFDAADEKNRIMVSFTQEYYTMAYQSPQGAEELFGADVSVADLKPYTRPGNPILYVASVTYGRRFYFLFESTTGMKDFNSAISASYGNPITSGNAAVSAEQKAMINSSNVKAFGIGGNAMDAVKAITGAAINDSSGGKTQMDVIHEFLVKNAAFNAQTPGVPISYTLRYLDNAEQAKIGFTVDFKTKDCITNSAAAIFYPEPDYKGYPLVLTTGRYTYDDLKKLGMVNDSISSIKMPPQLRAKIWEHGNFTGRNFEILDNHPNMSEGPANMNDFMSAVEINAR